MKARRLKYNRYDGSSFEGKDWLSYGDLDEAEDGELFEIPYCTFSDYSGGTVERSNCETFLKMFADEPDGVYPVYGGYGTRSVVVTEAVWNSDDVQDVVNSLNRYPVIDEEAWTELEYQLEEEAWDSWVKADLMRALGLEEEPDDLMEKWIAACERANEYFFCEDAVSAWIDVDKVVLYWE